MSLAEARAKAAEWHTLVRRGVDPKREEAAARRAADARTFASVAERYIQEHLAGQRRGKDGTREVRNYLVKTWGALPIADITPADVKALVGALKAKAPYQARNVLGHASTLFRWAVHNDLVAVSPVASLSKRWVLAGAKIGPRQRVLSDMEVAASGGRPVVLAIRWDRSTVYCCLQVAVLMRLRRRAGPSCNATCSSFWRSASSRTPSTVCR